MRKPVKIHARVASAHNYTTNLNRASTAITFTSQMSPMSKRVASKKKDKVVKMHSTEYRMVFNKPKTQMSGHSNVLS